MTDAIVEQVRRALGPNAITRFAPSPTGHLHLGHALSALTGYDLARRLGGRFLVRIEDIDLERCRPELIGETLDLLRWLGISWTEPVRRQSEHVDTYVAAAERLDALGLLYPCFASRTEIAAAATGATDPDGAPLYPGLHKMLPTAEVERRKAAGEPFAMRLDMPAALSLAIAKAGAAAFGFTELDDHMRPHRIGIDPARWGDTVIQRKTMPTSYHLSVVVDDALQGVTIVTRGTDLRPSTDVHRLLQILLDLPEPVYLHHRLLMGAEGKKLSKRDGSTSLAELRARGLTAADIRRMVGLDGNGG